MNIFAFDTDAQQAAMWLDDIRKNKMITETCQILSTAINILDPYHNLDIYKSFNPKHGSCMWGRSSASNFWWLLTYVQHLDRQRGPNLDGSPHHCQQYFSVFSSWFERNYELFPYSMPQEFSNNAARSDIGISYKWVSNPILAYRMYINDRWDLDPKPPTWRFGEQPYWRKSNE